MLDQLPTMQQTLDAVKQYVKDHPTEWCPVRRQFIGPNHEDLIIIDSCQLLPPSDPPLSQQRDVFQRVLNNFIQQTKASKVKFVFPLVSHDQYH